METQENHTRVGVGVLVMKDNKVLLQIRHNAHGEGQYASPGGHLEYLEGFAECAKRECMEEAGIEIENVRFLYIRNLTEFAPKHYVHISLVANWKSGEPKNMELDKGSEWNWYNLDQIPSPLFLTTDLAIEAYKTGENYFDKKS